MTEGKDSALRVAGTVFVPWNVIRHNHTVKAHIPQRPQDFAQIQGRRLKERWGAS